MKKISSFLDDIFLLIGTLFLSYGVFMIWIPLGFIVLGLCFIGFAYLIAKKVR